MRKATTKLLLGLGAAGAGVWAWMKYGSSASLAASRVVPPGYVSTRDLADGNGKFIARQYVYPAIGGVTTTFTLPVDPNGRGYYGRLA